MTFQHPTIFDIQTAELFYFDPEYIEACYRFCEMRDIDCLPEIGDSSIYYQRNDEIKSFDRQSITDKRQIEASIFIFQPKLLARFGEHSLQFVFARGVLTGVIHFSDYNRDIVSTYLYAHIARYERDLRELLALHSLNNDDMRDRFQEIVAHTHKSETQSFYEGKIKEFEKKRKKFARLPEFQGFYMRDLIDLAKQRDIIRLEHDVVNLRNTIMHAGQPVDMVDAHTPDYIYEFESFQRFFTLTQALLVDGQRIHNRLGMKRGLEGELRATND